MHNLRYKKPLLTSRQKEIDVLLKQAQKGSELAIQKLKELYDIKFKKGK